MIIIAIAFFVIGLIGRLFANIIGSLVSKQREFLADASAVQFTRNPNGIANALNKIRSGFGSEVSSASSSKFSHMFFGIPSKSSGFSAVFGTHPDRIKRIDPNFDFSKVYREKKLNDTPQKKVKRDNKGFIENVAGAVIATQVGNVQAVNIRKAGEILKKIPDKILAAASKKTEVIPMLYSLIIAGSKETKLISTIQERIVSEKHGKEFSINALKNKTDVMRQLDISLRLPLLNLIIPYIKQLSENEREKVMFCARGLSLADGTITTFEIAILQILKSALNDKDENFGSNNIENECRSLTVISFIASKGKMSKTETQKAVEKGLSVCRKSPLFSKVSNKLIPYDEEARRRLEIITLSNSSFKKKEVFLNAFSETINFDKKVTTQEKELQVAIFEALGCPHPKV